MAAGVSDSLVVGEAGCEREQSERDAAGEAGEGAGAVAFEAELAFAGPEHRSDPLSDGAEAAEAARLVLAVGSTVRTRRSPIDLGRARCSRDHEAIVMWVPTLEAAGRRPRREVLAVATRGRRVLSGRPRPEHRGPVAHQLVAAPANPAERPEAHERRIDGGDPLAVRLCRAQDADVGERPGRRNVASGSGRTAVRALPLPGLPAKCTTDPSPRAIPWCQ